MYNLNLVLPEIFISLSVMSLLILGVFKKNSSQLIFNLSLITFLIATIFVINETFSDMGFKFDVIWSAKQKAKYYSFTS